LSIVPKSNSFSGRVGSKIGNVTATRPLIAVVDDEECIRKALQRLMTSAGLAVQVFSSGAEFLEWLKQKRPACVVLDLHMPGVSGFDVQARLAEANDKLPVIVITGNHTDETMNRVTSAGASAYFTKPVDDEQLLAAVNEAIGSRPTHSKDREE
jgi:two-component system response regulator FixJ